jgi:hypothetical protein
VLPASVWAGRVALVACSIDLALRWIIGFDLTDQVELARVSFVFAALAFLVWVYFAAKHLWALNRFSLSPVTCVAYFFVPFVNIYKPFDVLAEILRGSKVKNPRSAQLCWGGFLFSRFAFLSHMSSWVGLGGLIALSAALGGMFWMIGSVSRAQPTLKRKKPAPITVKPKPNHPAWIDIGR